MRNWFDSFFNNHKILNSFENRDIPNILWFLAHLKIDSVKNLKVFDQCCGTGDVSHVFYQAGAQVSGCDLSENSLNMLHAKYPFLKNHIQANAQSYLPPEKQDIVLNFFSSFGYYELDEENEKLIEQCSSMLKENGIFLFELMDFDYLLENHKSQLIYKDIIRESSIVEGHICQKWIYQEKIIGETKIKIYLKSDLLKILKRYFNKIEHSSSQGRQVFVCRK